MNNREKLIGLITTYALERHEVAEMLKVERITVDHWLLSKESHNNVATPDMAIELLELKLKELKPKPKSAE